LIIGCGNSNLGIDMKNDGFENIVNIDYSEVVINKMKNKDPD
jgi:2-polyprenyl-3-methyl-5-hydroxy-6-metoxy-1,4-benzoquinol methylase